MNKGVCICAHRLEHNLSPLTPSPPTVADTDQSLLLTVFAMRSLQLATCDGKLPSPPLRRAVARSRPLSINHQCAHRLALMGLQLFTASILARATRTAST